MSRYQVAIIGSGSAGRAAALLAANQGLQTALIEKDRIGGTAFHNGCYAVTGLLGCARQFRDSQRGDRFGNEIDVLQAKLENWKAAQWSAGTALAQAFETELKELHVDFYQGLAHIIADQTLEIERASGSHLTIQADNIVVATGSRPKYPGVSHPKLVNSDQLLKMTTWPRRLAIIGGGHIGCEFASIYRTLGSEVTLIERQSRLLPGWEADASTQVATALQAHGVTIQPNRDVTSDQVLSKGESVQIMSPDSTIIDADLILFADGRRPNVDSLRLWELEIDDSSFLEVDANMRLPRAGMYAIGDVNGISLLDSAAFGQANTAIQHIVGQSAAFDPQWIPRCIHTDPCVAAVGCTEEEAELQNFPCRIASDTMFLVSDNPRSVIDPEPTFLKVIVDSKYDRLLGCMAAGDHAPTIVNTAAIAIRTGIKVGELRELGLAQFSATDALMSVLRKIR
ncbi:MAG: NAD(P)/FAD-dependent oxidoreductase [Verrucomicrobia bacterium]|nr:NAD(P)/FAD-dependent oxidoreductase [Verrucomicrobiota bacterium]